MGNGQPYYVGGGAKAETRDVVCGFLLRAGLTVEGKHSGSVSNSPPWWFEFIYDHCSFKCNNKRGRLPFNEDSSLWSTVPHM